MKINDALSRVDNLKPNDYSHDNKIGWLSELDLQVKTEILDTYEGAENITFSGYTEETSEETVLLVPEPFSEMYIHYLNAKIDYYNGEFKNHNTNITMFNTVFDNFRAYYSRTHKSKGVRKITYF